MPLVGERLHCERCGESTFHSYDFDPDEPEDSKRLHCSICDNFVEVPKVEGFCVTITNIADKSADPRPGQFCLVQHFRLTAQEAALEQALSQAVHWARGINSRGGIAPHGIMIDESALLSQAKVVPMRL